MFGPFSSTCSKLRDPAAFDAEISFLSPQSLKDLVDADTGDTGLHAAAAACNPHACQRLLQLGVDVNAVNKRGVTALCLAAGEGGLDTVQLLVSNGGDVDLCGKPDASARGANPFNLRGLSTPGVNSGALAFTPLQAACAGNHPGVVQYLCGKGANPVLGVPQSLGLTPLHFACMALGNEAAMVLLEHAGPTAIAHVDDLGRSCLAVTSTIDGGVMKAKLADIAAQAGVIVPASPESPTSEEESVDGHRVRDTRPVMRSKGASTVDKLPSVSRVVAPRDAGNATEEDGDALDKSLGEDRPVRRRNTAGSDVFDSPPRQSSGGDAVETEPSSESRPTRGKQRVFPGVDTSAEAADSDRAVLASPHDASPKQVLPVTIAKVFGGEVYQKLSSNSWKEREEALMQADIVLSSPHLLHSDGSLVFEAGCELLCAACEDKVAQIFYAAIPVLHTLLSGRTNATIPLDGQDTYSRGGVSLDLEGSSDAVLNARIQLMPELERLLSDLVAKTASATERTSDMASQALVHIACHTPIGPRCVSQVLLEFKSYDAGGGWRPLVGRCGVLEIIVGEFGIGGKSGISLEAVTSLITESLANPSVKARHAGTTLAVALTPNVIGASHEAHLSEAEALDALSTFVSSYFSEAKPLLQKALLAKMAEAARKHLGLSEFGAPPSARKLTGKTRDANRPPTPVMDSKTLSIGTVSVASATPAASSPGKLKAGAHANRDGGSGSDGDELTDAKIVPGASGSWLDVDLSLEDCTIAYAEPLSNEIEDSQPAIATTSWLGAEAARAAFSHDWKARRSVLMACAKKLSESYPRVTPEVIVAAFSLVKRTLPETVMSVCLAAEVLIWRLTRAVSSDDTYRKDFVSELPGMLPLIVARLGDSKAKVRATTVDLLARISQQPFVGLPPVLVALLSPDSVQSKRDNVHHISAILNLLTWLSKRHGMSSSSLFGPAAAAKTGSVHVVSPLSSDEGTVPVKDALDVAVIALQHRDKNARRAALKMFQCATSSTTAGPAEERLIVVGQVMSTLPSAVRSKLTKKLSELAEARQNALAKRAGHRGLDDVVVGTKSPVKGEPGKSIPADAGRLSPWATGEDVEGVVDDDNQAGGVSAVVSSGKLPDAPMLDDFTLEEKDQLISVVGEKAVRCFCSKAWTHRHAAIALVTRRVMDCVVTSTQLTDDELARSKDGECDVPPLPPRSAKVFMQLASMFESGLWDSVATVFLASVELMMAVTQNYLPMVSGKQLIVRAGLQPSVRAIVARLGDTKVRVRETCEVTLATLSSLSTVTPTMVFEALIDDMNGSENSRGDDGGPSSGPQAIPSPNAIIGRLKVLRGMIQSFGATTAGIIASPDGASGSLLDVTDMMCQFQQLLESRHVPIRNEAQSLYVAVYESMVGRYGMPGANVMNGFIGGLRPAQRSIVAAAVAEFNRLAGITVGGVTPEASLSPSKTLSSSQKLSASQLVSAPLSSGTSLLGDKDNADVVRAAIGIELASMLSSDGWQERQKGLWALAQAIVGGKVPLIPKATPPFWETILGVIKSALLDPASQVNVAVFDVVLAVTPDIEACQVGSSSTSKLVIPWDLWDVQLPLGSLVKTLFGKLGDIRRRVVDVTRRIIVRLAQVNKNCLAVITKALCATIALPSGDSIASTLGMRAVLAVTTRLRVLADVLECPVVASGTYSVPFEALLKWLTPLMTTNVKTVGQLAKYCAEMLLTGPDADQGEYATAISTFLSSCDPGTREYLDAAMTGSSRDGHVGDFGVAGFGLAISAADNSGMSARSDFSHTARSVDSNGSWEGLGVTGSATAGSQMAPSGIRSVSPTFVIQPAIRSPLVPPGSPIVHNPLGSPTGASSPLRRPTQPHRRVDSAGPSSSAFGHDGGSTGIALSGEPARRVPLAGRRALSAKDVPFSSFDSDGLQQSKPQSHITVADLPSLTLPTRTKAAEATWTAGPLMTSPITTSDDAVGFLPRSATRADAYQPSWNVGGGSGYGGIAGRSVGGGGVTGPSLYSGASSTVKAALAAQTTPTKPRVPMPASSPVESASLFPSPSPPALGRSQFRVTPTDEHDDRPVSFTVSSAATRESPNNRHRTLRLS